MVGARPSKEQPVRLGVLTGGGGCPRLTPVHPAALAAPARTVAPRSVARRAPTHYGSEVIGFRDGWRGLLENRTTPLDIAAVDGLLTRGGGTPGPARRPPPTPG